jgi:riboflavin-specific deaminase-like protein
MYCPQYSVLSLSRHKMSFPFPQLLSCYFLSILCFIDKLSAEIRPTDLQTITNIVRKINLWKSDEMESSNGSLTFVTLSFAQSIDGKIAKYGEINNDNYDDDDRLLSQNFPLSCEESLYMTHALRSIHDGILVGGKTLDIDNPRLTNRLWGEKQPRPIILDTNLENVQKLGRKRHVQNAIICCSHDAVASFQGDADTITFMGCNVNNEDGHIDLEDCLNRLRKNHNIRSIMVEGGSTVLSAFVSRGLASCICVTIAPKIICHGLNSFSKRTPFMDFSCGNNRFMQLGQDCIFVARWKPLKNQNGEGMVHLTSQIDAFYSNSQSSI